MKRTLAGAVLLSAAALLTMPGIAAAATRGYVFSMIHVATYGEAKAGDGSVCPKGGNGGTPEIKVRTLMTAGYSREEAKKLVATSGGRGGKLTDDKGNKVVLEYEYRGRFDGKPAKITNFPASVPDPHIELATGKYAFGFNLNGTVEPDSYEDPESHVTGVDNNLWRALGCFDAYNIRLPVRVYSEEYSWDSAIDSMPAWLLSISGDDLEKDGPVTVTFDRSLNILQRNTQGGVLSGSTFVIDTDPRFHSTFTGRIKDRVLTIDPGGKFALQGESQFYPVLRFLNTQLRLHLEPDGSLKGLIGGYMPWADYYTYLSVRDEDQSQVDLPGVYYAFKRLADGPSDPVTEEGTISSAFWMEAVPAYHATRSGAVVAKSVSNPDAAVLHTSASRAESTQLASDK
jgi:hypothetical protein